MKHRSSITTPINIDSVKSKLEAQLATIIKPGMLDRLRGYSTNIESFRSHLAKHLAKKIVSSSFDAEKYLPILIYEIKERLKPNDEDRLDDPELLTLYETFKDASIKKAAELKAKSSSEVNKCFERAVDIVKNPILRDEALHNTRPFMTRVNEDGILTATFGRSTYDDHTPEEAPAIFAKQMDFGRFTGVAATVLGVAGTAIGIPGSTALLGVGVIGGLAHEGVGQAMKDPKTGIILGRVGDKMRKYGGATKLVRGKVVLATAGLGTAALAATNPATATGSAPLLLASGLEFQEAFSQAREHINDTTQMEESAKKKKAKVTTAMEKRLEQSTRAKIRDFSRRGVFRNCLLAGAIVTAIAAVVILSAATFGLGIPAITAAGALSAYGSAAVGLSCTSLVGAVAYGKYESWTLPAFKKVRKVFGLETLISKKPEKIVGKELRKTEKEQRNKERRRHRETTAHKKTPAKQKKVRWADQEAERQERREANPSNPSKGG